MALAPHRFKFTLEDYYTLHDMGLFADKHVELWDGDIIEMTVNPPHALAIMRLQKIFERSFGDKVLVSSQNPLNLGEENTLPEPDLMLLKDLPYVDAAGKARHPIPADVLLLVEVSDSTLKDDRGRKLARYARHGIQEYWVADIKNEQWFVYRKPLAKNYQEEQRYLFAEAFAPSAFHEQARVWLEPSQTTE